jgi:Na+-transporting NADH:ubiquinone oxidoreductase subunit A
MATHTINKGLDLPISGAPQQKVLSEPKITRVAIVADDYPGMKARMVVKEGDTVVRGQLLFEDRKTEGVRYTAPGAGKVIGVNRGERRALQSLVIHLSESEQAGSPKPEELQRFESYTGKEPSTLDAEQIKALLVESGMWTALRTRPFSKVPQPDSSCSALFVTAIDSNPLAPDPAVVMADQGDAFVRGLKIVSKLTDGPTYVCVRDSSKIDVGDAKVTVEKFAGPHPSGTVGLHIHTLHPVGRKRTVWHLGYQDVIAIAKLFETGVLDVSRTVAVAGPVVKQPRLVKVRMGADVDDIVEKEFDEAGNDVRIVSGSVLSGKKAMGGTPFGFLGRYHNQLSVLKEGRERELLGWLGAGGNIFSVVPIFLSRLFSGKKFDFTTTTNGSARAMVPIGVYERVMPMDILPTFLLRSLVVGDVERAEQLGALELDEEDLALCTFVCPSKTNYGLILRKNLQTIEEEG